MKQNIERIMNLTQTQKGILYQESRRPNVYTEAFALQLHRPFTLDDITSACDRLTQIHEALRSVILTKNLKSPLFAVLKNVSIPIEQITMSGDIQSILQHERDRGIDISANALRIVFCTSDINPGYILFISHHIFLDGWSSAIIYEDFFRLLAREDILPAKPFSAYMQIASRSTDMGVTQQVALKGYEGRMYIPCKDGWNEKMCQEHFTTLPERIVRAVNVYCANRSITSSVLYHTTYALLLASYNFGMADFGIVSSGRSHHIDFIRTVGLFIKTIPVHLDLNGTSLKQLFAKVNQMIAEADRQVTPGVASLAPMDKEEFNSILVMENYPFAEGEQSIYELAGVSESTHYDLVLQIREQAETSLHLMTVDASYDLLQIAQRFTETLEVLLNLKPNAIPLDAVENQSCIVHAVAPFEQYYLKEAIEYCYSCFDMHADCLIHVAQNGYPLVDRGELIVVWAPCFVLDAKSGVEENKVSLMIYTQLCLDTIRCSAARKIAVIDLTEFAPIQMPPANMELAHASRQFIVNACSLDERVVLCDMNRDADADIWDNTMMQTANIPFSIEFFYMLARRASGIFLSDRVRKYKIIVVDGDETLWDGTIRNDGIEKITLGKDKNEFQRALLNLRKRGFLLALCTRNDTCDVRQLFDAPSPMLLQWDDFVAVVANDKSKADNIRNICAELQLGTDSVIFLDDSPHECAQVLQELPETLVLPVIGTSGAKVIENCFAFDVYNVTEEDLARTSMYVSDKKRRADRGTYVDQRDFWRSLETSLSFCVPVQEDIARIIQLSSRTNRFRINALPLSQDEVKKRIARGDAFAIRAEDRFGAYGLVGYLSWRIEEDCAILDRWYLSCRLSVEYAESYIWNFWLGEMKALGCKETALPFSDTGLNKRMAAFIKAMGFRENAGLVCSPVDSIDARYLDIPVVCKKGGASPTENVELVERRIVTCNSLEIFKYAVPLTLLPLDTQKLSRKYWRFLQMPERGPVQGARSRKRMPSAQAGLWANEELRMLKGFWEEALQCEVTDVERTFSEYGGRSISYMELMAVIASHWKMDITAVPFEIEDTLLDHLKYIGKYGANAPAPIVHRSLRQTQVPPFSERMLAMHGGQHERALHMPFLMLMDEECDVKRFFDAFHAVIQAYRIFHAKFYFEPQQVSIHFEDKICVAIDEYAADFIPDSEFIDQLIRPFDLTRAPLVHLAWINCSENQRNYVFVDFCHLIIDGPSIAIIVKQLHNLIAHPENVNELCADKVNYFDYCQWYSSEILVAKAAENSTFWLKELQGNNPGLSLPLYRRGNEQKAECEVERWIPRNVSDSLYRLAVKEGVTEFTLMLSLYAAFLHRLSGQERVHIGIPISCREHIDALHEPGMMVNTLVYKSLLSRATFQEFLGETNAHFLNIARHKDIMLQDVMSLLRKENYSEGDLFDTLFIYQDYNLSSLHLGHALLEEVPYHGNSAQSMYDMKVFMMEDGMRLATSFDSKRLSFDNASTIMNWFLLFIQRVICIDSMRGIPVACMPLLDDAEVERIIQFEGTGGSYDGECVTDTFARHVEAWPDAPCILLKDWTYTYRELNNASNRYARDLIQLLGDGRHIVMTICDDPSIIACSLLGTMKAGKVYLPVAPTTPDFRLQEIIRQCNVAAYTSMHPREDIVIPYLPVDTRNTSYSEDIRVKNDTDNLAYIIYTSGTTGVSKGVMATHGGLANAVFSRIKALSLTSRDRALHLMGYAFDGFMQTFFSPLLSGSSLYMLGDIRDFSQIESALLSNDITTFLTTPTLYRTLLNAGGHGLLSRVDMVSLAGETLEADLVELSAAMYPRIRLINEYGPTENTIITTINTNVVPGKDITIGRPIDNCKVCILDCTGERCACGHIGELYLSGASLSAGYIGDEDLTANKFVYLFDDGVRWYRTGDLATWTEQGDIVLVGRNDSQIKVNGFRIDTREIEEALRKVDGVYACAVTFDAERSLFAYYCADRTIPYAQIVAKLQHRLESYMIPSGYARVREIPIRDSGKIDYSRLESLLIEEPFNETNPHMRRMAQELAALFADILHIPQCSIEDNFYALGGNSIKAMLLTDLLGKKYGLKFDVEGIRLCPTPVLLARKVILQTNEKTVELRGVRPFNKFWFIDCFSTSLLSILEFYCRPIDFFVRAFRIQGVESKGEYKISFEQTVPLDVLLSHMALTMEKGILEEEFESKLQCYLREGIPVLLHVDCYYIPYHKDTYLKRHYRHVITLSSWDESEESYQVIDQQNLSSISFDRQVLSRESVLDAARASFPYRKDFGDADFVALLPNKHDDVVIPVDLPCSEWPEVVRLTLRYLEEHSNPNVPAILEKLINYFLMEHYVALCQANDVLANDMTVRAARLKRFLMDCLSEEKSETDHSVSMIHLLQQWLA